MENLDDSENNAKVSDSAYSNSCSNSQSRRSHSSKSTHSGSHSSGSSGYGGKPLAYSDNSGQPSEKRVKEKDVKKKKLAEKTVTEVLPEVEEDIIEQTPAAEVTGENCQDNVKHTSPSPQTTQVEMAPESMDTPAPELASPKNEGGSSTPMSNASANYVMTHTASLINTDGFSCVISMHDGVVMYTSSTLTSSLGFPKEMWIGRSFIDFVHPRDRHTFASHITSGVAVPKNVNCTQEEVTSTSANSVCTMVCRIRRYRSLFSGFAVKDRVVTFMPFMLKLTFKNVCENENRGVYLVIQATPFFSAFKTPNEVLLKPIPFTIRHAANGILEYIDPESVRYLGYLPHDLADTDALQMYHVDDLPYLRQIYEIIVREGGVPRSKPFRLMAQNGDFLKVETEWSSFINPWSRKLEFVTGKHQIVEGPANPDVFQTPDNDKSKKLTESEEIKAKALRESIIRIMNEVLTRPAEVAKQQITKRCNDLASFMESLIEDEPKKYDEELRVEIQDPDTSYYERDSEMLGGISPHHEHNDSQSSTETPLSYTQLNYNETLERYFSSQPVGSPGNPGSQDNVLGLKNFNAVTGTSLSPVTLNSRDSGEMSASDSGGTFGAISSATSIAENKIRLTESLLNKHNKQMEKRLMKLHRETRSSKGDREKVNKEAKLKKKQHLARCNAAFKPTDAGVTDYSKKSHGVKRASRHSEAVGSHKHHCGSARPSKRRQSSNAAPNTAPTAVIGNPWAGNAMNAFIVGVGIPHQMTMMGPMTAMPVQYMMYGTPVLMNAAPMAYAMPQNTQQNVNQNIGHHVPQHVTYNMDQHAHYNAQHDMSQLQQNNNFKGLMGQPLSLANSNYEEACKQSLPRSVPQCVSKPRTHSAVSMWREKHLRNRVGSSKLSGGNDSSCSSNTQNRGTDSGPTTLPSGNDKKGSDDRTDGESSYSSFYSSFFKTDSGSAEESGDAKKNVSKGPNPMSATNVYYDYSNVKNNNITKRKMEPPWMEKVALTSELVYKYQIVTKSVEEVLKEDRLKLKKFEQPALVNDQLGQLYLDLQLEGVASRLTLEEGITCSSSSEEETTRIATHVVNKSKVLRRKREYSKLVMIYEEDAPIPSPEAPPEPTPGPSTSACT